MTAGEQLVIYSTLDSPNTALDHFKNITFNATFDGDIILNSGKWANIAIPVEGKKVKEYFLDWIEQETGRPAQDSVLLVKSFPSTDSVSGKYLTFVPGVTNPLSSGNFDLVVTDNGIKEITGFLIKMKDYSSFYNGVLSFHWDRND